MRVSEHERKFERKSEKESASVRDYECAKVREREREREKESLCVFDREPYREFGYLKA